MTATTPSINRFGQAIHGAAEGPATQSGSTHRHLDNNDAQRFSEMMREDTPDNSADRHDAGKNADGSRPRNRDASDGDRDSHHGRDGNGNHEEPALSSPFDLLRTGSTQTIARPEQTAASKSADLQGIVDAVADRILVRNDADGSSEIRIQLKESLLPGVEVRIRHDAGRLVVEFVSANADSTRFLDGQRDGLAGLLEARLKCDVDVRVTASNGTDGGGDTGDGRSRNSYVSPSENEDSTETTGEFGS